MGCRLCQNYIVSRWMVNTLTYSLQGDESISSVSSEATNLSEATTL